MGKVFLALGVAVLATIVGANVAYQAKVAPGDGASHEPWALSQMKFVAWNGETWIGWVRNGAFEHRPGREGKWSPHANSTIAFLDWDGQPWQAKIDGDEFLLSHRGDWNGAVERAAAVKYRDWQGQKQLRTLAQLTR